MFQSVITNCQEFVCTPECLDYWRTLRQHPCFQGDVYELLMHYAKLLLGEQAAFFNRLDSCSTQLAEVEDGPIGEGTRIAGPCWACVLVMVLNMLF